MSDLEIVTIKYVLFDGIVELWLKIYKLEICHIEKWYVALHTKNCCGKC